MNRELIESIQNYVQQCNETLNEIQILMSEIKKEIE